MTNKVKRILIISVGGSLQPLRSSIRETSPDEIVFVVSDGSDGTKSSESQVVQLFGSKGYPDKWEIISVPPDKPDIALSKIDPILFSLSKGKSEIIVDYTGGTKSMTSALFLAATSYENVNLQLMAGVRPDLESVEDGTENPTVIPTDLIGISNSIRTIRNFIEQQNYASASLILRQTHNTFRQMKSKIPSTWDTRILQWKKWVQVFELWDRFDHVGALQKIDQGLLQNQPFSIWFKSSEYFPRLQKLKDCNKSPAPELLEDLWLNADRCARLGLYDDAIARLYRLMEAVTQTRLHNKHGLDASKIPVPHLPNGLRNKFKPKKKASIGLSDSMDLLYYLEKDPIWNEPLPSWKKKRNNSILAHGYEPLTEKVWEHAKIWFYHRRKILWEDLLGRPTAGQLPHNLPDLENIKTSYSR